jgi:hypothetical protein
MMRVINRWVLILMVLLFEHARAQNFRSRANLDSVSQSGFFAIPVTPALSAQVKTDFSDLRIFDEKGKAVPYLMSSEIPFLDSAAFKPLQIIKNILNDSGQTVLVIRNGQNEKTDGFYIRIRNAAVSRTMNLSGSNDNVKWYSIMENMGLDKQFIQTHDSFEEYISFPLSTYNYFRVLINNGKNDPLEIISVKKPMQLNHVRKDSLIQNPCCSFVRKDSNQITWITVNNMRNFHISALRMRVKSPRYFKRQLEILAGGRLAGDVSISSDSVFNLGLPRFNDSLFTIKIYNDDNPPLEITGISTGQMEEKIITWLEAGKSYHLEMNDAKVNPPHYDLISFKDSIPGKLQEIGFSDITLKPLAVSESKSGFKSFWLWPSLILVILVLGLFTYRLTNDVAKKP